MPQTKPHPDTTPDWDAQFATPEQLEAAAAEFRSDYARVKAEIGKAVVGHEPVVDGVLTCLFTAGHALLEGVPGIGKTLLVRTLSRALSLDFARVQFTPDLMPADITGTTVVHESEADGRTRREFRFAPGPIFAQIVLADEINRATPKTQSALLEAMQEQSVTVGGTTHRLPSPFFVMATQNPIEQEGTYPLPEAQLDRFFFKLLVGYSGRAELAEIMRRTTTGARAEVGPVLDGARIVRYQQLVRRVAIAPHVRDYAVRMVLATHPRDSRYAGGAVRDPHGQRVRARRRLATRGPGARAGGQVPGLDNRAAAGADDVREIALPALRHRIILNFEGEAEGVTTDSIVENIAATLPVEVG